MKKFIALFLALILCVSLCACAGNNNASTDDTSKDNGNIITDNTDVTKVEGISEDAELKVAIIEEPDYLLAPYGNPTEADAMVMPCLYDSLFTTDDNGDVVGEIADSYEWIDDTHIRIKIKDNVIAYDGTTLTANDVLYSLQVGNTSNYAEYFQMYLNVDNCKVEDDSTIVLELCVPNPDILFLLGDIPFYVIDESSVEASGGIEANILMPCCGTGRYKIKEWKSGQYIKLERNDDYWGDISDSYYKYITFTWIADAASRTLNVKSGDVDIAPMLAYADVISVINDSALNVVVTDSPRSVNVTFHCADGKIFSNAKLREAVYYAINTADCAATVYGQYANRNALGVATISPIYYDLNNKVEYNQEKAKQALSDAGYPNGFEFTLTVEPGAGYDVVAELMQAQLKEVGITMNIDKVELVDYFTNVAGGNYDAYIGTLSTGDATTFLNQCDGRKDYMASHGGPAFNSDEMNALIDEYYSSTGDASAAAAEKIQEYAFENHIFIGICDYSAFNVMSNTLAAKMPTTGFGYPQIYKVAPAA